MHYLFELNHPKHFHQFKNLFDQIIRNKDSFDVIARDKDVLLALIKENKIPFYIFGKRGNTIISKLFSVPKTLYDYYRIVKKIKPDVVISKASPFAAIIGRLLKIPTVITPDSEVVFLNQLVAPLSSLTITQRSFNRRLSKNQKYISGFFETTYLHPNYFRPMKNEIAEENLEDGEKYFIIRFIGWDANHDVNQFGFSTKQKIDLVKCLEKYGRVIITSEKNLPVELDKYIMRISPSKIHHLLSFAHLYVGDSQSMATEAAILGTPSIRYNSFVGKNDMSNFNLLQEKYNLLINCCSFEDVINYSEKIIRNSNARKKWKEKANTYFKEVGDTNKEMLKLINAVLKKK
ncbi:MAG: DUF354 domain-containing protein [Ignavibacteria bacterium]